MERSTEGDQDKTLDEIDDAFDVGDSSDLASGSVTVTVRVHSEHSGPDLEELETPDIDGLTIKDENKERHGSEDSTGFEPRTLGITDPSDNGSQLPRNESEPTRASNVSVRLSGTIEETGSEAGAGHELPRSSDGLEDVPSTHQSGDTAERIASGNNAEDEVGEATSDTPSDVLDDIPSSETTRSTGTDFAPPFASTHSHVTLIHCSERGSFKSVQETRPLEQCPLCFRTARDETLQLVPGTDPLEASASDLSQTPLEPFGNYRNDFISSADTLLVPDVVLNWHDLAQQPPSPSLSVRSSRNGSSPSSSPRTPSEPPPCRYQNLNNAQHVTSAFEKPFKEIRGIASSAWTDDIYLVDSWNARIVFLNKYGEPTLQFGRNGSGEGEFRNPHGITISERDEIIVADYWNNRIQMFDMRGRFLREFGRRHLTNPVSVAYVDGKIYVCDERNITYFRYDGSFIGRYQGNILTPWAIAKGPQNSFVVVDGAPLHKVYSFNEQCRQGAWFPTPQQGLLSCKSAGITVDPFGYKLVTNPRNESIDVYTPGTHQRCCSITDQRKAMGVPYDVTVLKDGRVAAGCDGKVVIFRESRVYRTSGPSESSQPKTHRRRRLSTKN